MKRISRLGLIISLLLPFTAKLAYGAGLSLAFIYPSSDAQEIGVYIAALLFAATMVMAIVHLFRRAFARAGMVFLALVIAIVLPRIDFDPEYVLFRNNRDGYRAELDRDPSPSPKFRIFPLRELASFPAGGDFYEIVYDETGQIGRPEADRTPDWTAKHGHLRVAEIRGNSNPHAALVIRSFGDNFFLMVAKY